MLADAEGLETRFIEALPFSLTGAQARALKDVDGDLGGSLPMVRLIQGDVGCGKTVVAAAAAARAAGSGFQAALMAPTELLAEQHWRNFSCLVQASRTYRSAVVGLAACKDASKCIRGDRVG